jgi:hypothetical protein
LGGADGTVISATDGATFIDEEEEEDPSECFLLSCVVAFNNEEGNVDHVRVFWVVFIRDGISNRDVGKNKNKKKEKQMTFSSKIEKLYLLFHYQRKRKR